MGKYRAIWHEKTQFICKYSTNRHFFDYFCNNFMAREKIFRFKQFQVVNDRTAMKVGTDGVLLGAWCQVDGAQRVLDVGTGCGVIALMVSQRNPTARIDAIDIDHAGIEEARHNFIYRGWDVTSDGNELAHVVLRGSVNKHGNCLPNYHYEDLLLTERLYDQYDLKNPAIIVDCNHANSNKQAQEQIRISHEVLHSRSCNPDLKKLVKGLMIESYLVSGRQDIVGGEGHVYGKSITDPCLGWEKSEALILDLYERL